MAEEVDFLAKVIVIGDSSTGKTCILRQYIDGIFPKNAPQTLGIEFGSKCVNILSHRLKLQIWDTAGQERFRSVTRSYYRGAAAAVVVYDITRLDTFTHVQDWLADLSSLTSNQKIVVMVVGNKSDLSARRSVSTDMASNFCREKQLLWSEASALTGDNIELIFTKVMERVLTDNKADDVARRVLRLPIATPAKPGSNCEC